MTNKKGALGNQTMIFSWILLIVIIAGSIVAGVYLFFGATYDFRPIDATILNSKVSECLREYLTEPNSQENFLELCNLNEKVINNTFLIIIKNLDSGDVLKYGRGDLTQCALSDKNKAFPICKNSTQTINSEKYLIITGSHQKIKRGLT